VEAAYLLFTLLCPLSMVALVAWWAWSMRRSSKSAPSTGESARSVTDEAEMVRMRARLQELQGVERAGAQQRR
jgi:type VI protein secretion system component VasK